MSSSSRNFISHALPYSFGITDESHGESNRAVIDVNCALALCTSSSFMNGSLAPEMLLQLQKYKSLVQSKYVRVSIYPELYGNWELFNKLAMIMLDCSSTIQFTNSLNNKMILPLDHHGISYYYESELTTQQMYKYEIENYLLRMIFGTRYFIRQCKSLQLALLFHSKAIFEICLPKLSGLRKLVLGDPDSSNDFMNMSNEANFPSESELIAALTSARNLDTLGLHGRNTICLKDGTLEKIWEVNEMKHLRTFELSYWDFSQIDNLRVISDFHPNLTSLSISRYYVRTIFSEIERYELDSDFFPPNLAVMTELQNFHLHLTEGDGDDVLEKLLPSSSDCCFYLKFLRSIHLSLTSASKKNLLSVLEKLDGSLLRDLDLRIYNPSSSLDTFVHSNADVELITSRFHLLNSFTIRDCGDLASEFLKSIGKNLRALRKLKLVYDTHKIDDDGVSYLFDPGKCTGGIYGTLEELTFGHPKGLHYNLDGLNWFGSGLGDSKNNYCLKVLDLGCHILLAEGFVQICTAFSHCLEQLSVTMRMEGSLKETKKNHRMPVMKALKSLSLYNCGSDLSRKGAANAGVIFSNCIKLNFVEFCGQEDTFRLGIDPFMTHDFLHSFADNVVEDESKFLTVQFVVLHQVESVRRLAPFGLYEAACTDSLSKLKTLRRIHSAGNNQSNWNSLKQSRPDIIFSDDKI